MRDDPADRLSTPMLDSIVQGARRLGRTDAPRTARRCARRFRRSSTRCSASTSRARSPVRRSATTSRVYPALGLAGGACEGYGLLLDIHDPAHPVRLDAVADTNFSYWHSATFNNDGTKLLFTDEWGGGGAPKCRATDPHDWGADAIFSIDEQQAALPELLQAAGAADAAGELRGAQRLAHPDSRPRRDGAGVVSGRRVGVRLDGRQASAGDRVLRSRPARSRRRWSIGGSWSAYWYNGVIVSSEIARGLDIFELTPSALLTQNEIDAAKTVHLDYLNVQDQPHFIVAADASRWRARTWTSSSGPVA